MYFIRVASCFVCLLVETRVKGLLGNNGEPVCYSRFDYETKLHRGMARLEVSGKRLQETTEGLQDEVKDLKSEIKAFPSTTAFMAQLSSDLEIPAVGQSRHVIIFDDVITNVGGDFNKFTGAFTAPVDAVYHFNLEISVPNGNPGQVLHVTIQKNAERAGYIFFVTDERLWLRKTTSVTHHLSRGDTVQPVVEFSQGSKPNVIAGKVYHSHFSGFMIGS